MGDSIAFCCKNCYHDEDELPPDSKVKTSWNFKTGIGMMYSPDDLFHGHSERSLFDYLVRSKSIKKKAKELLEQGFELSYHPWEFDSMDYGHEVYLCKKCNNFYERFYFKLKKDDEFYEPDYKCHRCKHLLIRVHLEYNDDNKTFELTDREGNSIEWNCANCNGTELTITPSAVYMLWD